MRTMRSGSNTQTGFTLMELLVVAAVIAIMAGIATPFMGDQVAKQRINADYRSIRDTMKMAKNGSTDKDFSSVVVCPGTESGCDAGAKWEDGFIAFGDVDGNGEFSAADVDDEGVRTLIAIQDKLSKGTTLTVTDENNGGVVVTKIALALYGYTADFKADDAPLYLFKYCNTNWTDEKNVKGLVYGPGGVIRMVIDTDDDGIPNFDSTPLTCP
jgi:prepilin-type N-terminal cleavage/methylation domain-containing protein